MTKKLHPVEKKLRNLKSRYAAMLAVAAICVTVSYTIFIDFIKKEPAILDLRRPKLIDSTNTNAVENKLDLILNKLTATASLPKSGLDIIDSLRHQYSNISKSLKALQNDKIVIYNTGNEIELISEIDTNNIGNIIGLTSIPRKIVNMKIGGYSWFIYDKVNNKWRSLSYTEPGLSEEAVSLRSYLVFQKDPKGNYVNICSFETDGKYKPGKPEYVFEDFMKSNQISIFKCSYGLLNKKPWSESIFIINNIHWN